jgi:hypothetical protein
LVALARLVLRFLIRLDASKKVMPPPIKPPIKNDSIKELFFSDIFFAPPFYTVIVISEEDKIKMYGHGNDVFQLYSFSEKRYRSVNLIEDMYIIYAH